MPIVSLAKNKKLSLYLNWWAFIGLILFMLTVPTPTDLLPHPAHYFSSFIENIVQWVGTEVFCLVEPYSYQLSSDSTGLYIHLLLLLALSALLAIILINTLKRQLSNIPIQQFLVVLMSYYLAYQLLNYGVDKVFKHQFYLPEPNTLYTPLGQASPDLLYWSTMGISYKYSVFAGLLEVVPACFLLFRKTRVLGALISLAIMLNVFMINIGFNLSVKLFSAVLLVLSIGIVWPHCRAIYTFFVLQKPQQLNLKNSYPKKAKARKIYALTKAVVISLILLEVFWGYFQVNNFNDDAASRPFLHGGYELVNLKKNNRNELLDWTNKDLWKRVFIHRKGYFIVQYMDDRLKDYKLSYNTDKKLLFLNEQWMLKYEISQRDETTFFRLNGIVEGDTLQMTTKSLDWQQLPAVQNDCFWTIDAYR